MCAILDIARQTHNPVIEAALSQTRAWPRLLNVFIERSDHSIPKSMRQVLTSLTNFLKAQFHAASTGHEVSGRAIQDLLQIVFADRDHIKVKPALQALTEFLAKELASLSYILATFEDHYMDGGRPENGHPQMERRLSEFLVGVFSWVCYNDIALAAGQLSTQIMEQYTKCLAKDGLSQGENSPPVWSAPILSIIRRKPDSLSNFRNTVFPSLFKLSSRSVFNFLQSMDTFKHLELRTPIDPKVSFLEEEDAGSSDAKTELLFCALQTGKELGIVKETGIRTSELPTFSRTDLLQTVIPPFVCMRTQCSFASRQSAI